MSRQESLPNDERPEAESVEASRPLPDSSTLERVLRETLLGTEDPLTDEELEALKKVARAHQAEQLTVDPVGVQLVTAVLMNRFASYSLDNATWQSAAREIAQSLFDAPDVWRRVTQFWDQLCESI